LRARGVPKEVVNKLLTAHKTALKKNGIEINRIPNGLEHTVATMGHEELRKENEADFEFRKKCSENWDNSISRRREQISRFLRGDRS